MATYPPPVPVTARPAPTRPAGQSTAGQGTAGDEWPDRAVQTVVLGFRQLGIIRGPAETWGAFLNRATRALEGYPL